MFNPVNASFICLSNSSSAFPRYLMLLIWELSIPIDYIGVSTSLAFMFNFSISASFIRWSEESTCFSSCPFCVLHYFLNLRCLRLWMYPLTVLSLCLFISWFNFHLLVVLLFQFVCLALKFFGSVLLECLFEVSPLIA